MGRVEKGLVLADTINNMLVENKSNGLTINESSEGLLKNVETLSISSSEIAASLEEVTSNISSNTENIIKISSFVNELSISSNDGRSKCTSKCY